MVFNYLHIASKALNFIVKNGKVKKRNLSKIGLHKYLDTYGKLKAKY